MNKEDISPYNNKQQPHGYWEVYLDDDRVFYKIYFVNGKRTGYMENPYNDVRNRIEISFIL